MKTRILTSAALAATLATPAYSAEHQSSREELIGVGSGTVAGALAGGPIGAVVGAVVGVVLGERFNRQKLARANAETELELTRVELAALETELVAANGEITRLIEQADDATLEQAIADGVRFDVLFRTAESGLEGATAEQLREFALLLAALPAVRIQLDGHADPRGDDTLNDELAARRAETVRDRLIAVGVSPGRITTQAHGARESMASEGDLDAYAFERRVSITLLNDTQAVAHKSD